MNSSRIRVACALALSAIAPVSAWAQQLPDLAVASRIRVRTTTVERRIDRDEVGYVTRLAGDSLHYRVVGRAEGTAVPWERVSTLEVSEGVRTTSLGTHLMRVGGAAAFGAVLGWFTWHSCSQQPGYAITLDCVVTPARLGATTRGGATLGAGIGVFYTLAHLKSERWRTVPTPGAMRLTVRRAGGGVGVGVALAF